MTEQGEVVAATLEREGPALVFRATDGATGSVPARVIVTLMQRYGRELEAPLPTDGERIELPKGQMLIHFRWRAAVDVEGKDYLALTSPGEPPIAALGTTIAAALDHLLRAQTMRVNK